MKKRTLRTTFTAATAIMLALTIGTATQPSQAIVSPTQDITPSTVGMQMFMWNWKSLATECTKQLGPAGVNWIQVSPPEESIDGSAWWTVYQPLSYNIMGKLGSESEFANMVQTCNRAGVDVIADAVINHMAAGGFSFPDVPYASSNFHAFTTQNHCDHNIENWSDVNEIQNCSLGGLSDLATEQTYVQDKIAGYLNHLLALGVKGFRIDAAKHIPVADLLAIRSKLTDPNALFINEVIGGPPDPTDYYAVGSLFDFDYASNLKSTLSTFNGATNLDLPNGQYRGMGDTTKEIQMVTNHDTERNGNSLNYTQGKNYLVGMLYTLAEPFGIPMLYSGYAFDNFDDGPRLSDAGLNTCNSGSGPISNYKVGLMVCPERWTSVRGMIRWHKFVDGETKVKMWSNRTSYGYARGVKGYFLMNTGSGTTKYTKVSTGLPAGTYCDVVTGGATPSKVLKGKTVCVGTTVTIAKGGYFTGSLPTMSVLAIANYSKIH